METTTVKLYSLDYSNVKTYWAASLFIIGNILFRVSSFLVGIRI